MIILILLKMSSLFQSSAFSIPLATQLNDVVVGTINVCSVPSGGGGLLGGLLGLLGGGGGGCVTTQTIAVSYTMTQIPTVIVYPMLLQNSGSASMSFECFVVPGSITLSGFTATVTEFGSTTLDHVQLSYVASFNPNIKFQQIAVTGYSNNYQQVFNFAKTYSQIPQVFGFITYFQYSYLVDYDIEQVTTTNFVFKLNTVDLSGTLKAIAIIIDQTKIPPTTNSYIGVYQNLIKLISPTNTQTQLITNLNFCPNWSSNQAIFGFTQLGQQSKQASYGVQLSVPFDTVNCKWSLTIQTAFQNSVSVQFASLALLTCQDALQSFSNFKCYCPIKYYDNLNKCKACDKTCLTCSGSLNTNCQSCDPLNFRLLSTQTCLCQSGYYDNNINAICQVCQFTCFTCNGGLNTNCQTCQPSNFRIYQSSSCVCQNGYYDDQIHANCDLCDITCLTCNGGLKTNCQSCQPLSFRSYSLSSCICLNGYYDDNINSTCKGITLTYKKVCDSTCLTCNGGAKNNCYTCPVLSLRLILSSMCQCQNGFYDDNINVICKLCDPTCQTCTGNLNTNCSSCNQTQSRSLILSTCVCSVGYYYNNQTQCQSCSTRCQTCSGPSQINCSSCVQAQQRSLLQNQCVCMIGFAEQGQDNCSKIQCHYSCNTCYGINSNQCMDCSQTLSNHRIQSGSSCLCQDGYFENGSLNCSSCDFSCKTCNGSTAGSCLSCFNTSLLNLTICQIIPAVSNQSLNINISVPQVKHIPLKCSNQQFLTNYGCINCHPLCQSCKGPTVQDCLYCNNQKYLDLQIQSLPPWFCKYDIDIQMNIQSYTCFNNQILKNMILGNDYTGQWTIIDNQNQTSFTSVKGIITDEYNQLNIPPNTLNIKKAPYQVIFNLFNKTQQVSTKSTSLSLDALGRSIQLQPASTRWGYKQHNQIKVLVFDLEISDQPLTNLDQFQVSWSCTMNFNDTCQNIYMQPLSLNRSDIQEFDQSTLKPYNSYFFKVTVQDQNGQNILYDQSIIQVYENTIPSLVLTFNPDYLIKRVNLQEEIIIKYSYDGSYNPDLLFFSANLHYDFNVVATIRYNYFIVKLVIWDHFIDFDSSKGLKLVFIGSVFNPLYFMPSQSQIIFNVNQPPQGCFLLTDIDRPLEMIQLIEISVQNCTDSDQPLLYKFYILTSQQARWDIGVQFQESIALNDFQSQNMIQTYILYHSELFIMASILDSYGGITNITKKISVTKIQDQSLLQNISSIIVQLQDHQLLRYLLVLTKSQYISEDSLQIMVQKSLSNLYLRQGQNPFWYQQLTQTNIFMYSLTESAQQHTLIDNIENVTQFVDERIKDLLLRWSSIELRKPYEGSMIQIQSATSDFLLNLDIITSLISSLIQSNNNNNQSTSKNSSNSSFLNKLYLQYINDIGDIKVINTLPNEKIISFSQLNIQMQSAQMTELILSQYLSPKINFFEDSASNIRILGNTNLTSNASFKIYSLKMVGTSSNPYSTDSQWNYTGSNHSVKTYNVSSGSIQSSKLSDLNNQTGVHPKSSIDYQINSTITINQSNSKQICISQNHSSQEWGQKDCQFVNINNQDICQCRTFSSVTIIDDLSGLLTKNDQIFDGSTLNKLSNFKWYAVAIFYVLACVTVIFFITLVWAVLKDQRDQLCVIFPQDKMNIIQTPDDFGKFYIPQSPPPQSQEDSAQPGRFYSTRNSRRNSTHLTSTRMITSKRTIVIPDKESDQELFKLDSNKNINIPKSSDSQESIEILSKRANSIGAKRIKKGDTQITKFTFINFILINHKLLGIFNNYDPLLSRGIRITLLYFQFLFSLSSILYFGIEINIQKTILLILITSIASSLVSLLITHGLSSSNLFIKSFGSLIFLGITLFLIYAALAIISTTQTTSQSNIWTLQYVASFFFQETFYMLVVMFIKYQITKPILDDIDSHNCLKIILFSKSELISLELAFKSL